MYIPLLEPDGASTLAHKTLTHTQSVQQSVADLPVQQQKQNSISQTLHNCGLDLIGFITMLTLSVRENGEGEGKGRRVVRGRERWGREREEQK